MLPCNRRQKMIKDDILTLRCINRRSEIYGLDVDMEACSMCPVRTWAKLPPCKRTLATLDPPVGTPDKEVAQEVIEMIHDSPLKDVVIEGVEIKPEGEGPTPEYPKMSMQLWMYKEALMRWHKEGRPTRSDEEVTKIHDTHCVPCEWYDSEQKRCKGCGCKVTVGSIAVFNKLKMATEHCPKEKF